MNIYELEKQATPGPLTNSGCTILAPTGWVSDRDPWVLGASETFHMASTDENHRGHDEQEANAKLFVHCRNNFMQALEALKRARRSMGCRCSNWDMCGHEHDCECAVADRIIAKLERVKP